ncbi:hypothetical protein EDB83DRAFT_2313447 [Lactarius deliciosus]|nr:hypothetical protein EDB83DRAFT_2313447 [Lactarius deliciosus]
MQPLKRKRDESPTTPQKLMKIQLTVGRRLTCVVPGPLVIPATPSPPPPPPPSPEDQVLVSLVSVWNLLAHAAYAYALVSSRRKKREKEGKGRGKGEYLVPGLVYKNLFTRTSLVWNAYAVRSLRRFRLLVKWEDDGERANLCGPGQLVVIRICAMSPSGKRQYVEQPSAVLAEKATAHLGHQLTIGMCDSA